MADATQFYVSGPAYVWCGIGNSFAFRFLGFTETGLTIEFVPNYEDIQVDYAGNMPGDVALLGQEARISGTWTRYNESVANQLASFGGNAGQFGAFINNQMGSLVTLENLSYPLLVYSPYSVKAVFDGPTPPPMVPGFVFYSAYISDPTRTIYSIRRKAPEFTWRAIPVFGNFSGSTFTPNAAPYNASIVAALLFTGTQSPVGNVPAITDPSQLPPVN